MKKYQIILTVLIIVFYLLSLYISYMSFKKSREIKLADINHSVINIKNIISINEDKIYHSTYKSWGIDINKILKNREDKKQKEELKLDKVDTDDKINSTNKKICIKNNCWIFKGVVDIGNNIQVTLISTDTNNKKEHLETFKIGDELLEDLVIKKITEDSMILIDKKENKKFVLKLFDINVSKYSPKIIKEANE